VHPRDPRPARRGRDRVGSQGDPARRRPDRELERDPRDHGSERLRQVHARLLHRGPPQVHRDPGAGPPRRRGRPGDGRRRARPRRPVPRDAVPRRGPRGLDVELPALGRHRHPRRGAEGAALGQGGQGRDVRPRHRPGVRRAQRQRGLLRRREEAARGAADVAAQAQDRRAGRDRLGPRRRRAARRQQGRQRLQAVLRRGGPADHALHAHPALHRAGPRPRLRQRPRRRVRRPRARRRARGERLRALPGRLVGHQGGAAGM
ncbi:MAG: Iron-sulfur cluster assembly ATPase protein SufC, partial [uncultured Actinomycetospora sp.]